MKNKKQTAAVAISILMFIMMLPIPAVAAGSIDLNHEVSLTISYQAGAVPLSGARFDLFLTAAVNEYGEVTPVEPFDQFQVEIQGKDDDAWKKLASTLEGYVLQEQLSSTASGTIDTQGTLLFDSRQNGLNPGLYLVLGKQFIQNRHVYEAVPFMVMLPELDKEANAWVYDATAIPKYTCSEIPEEPETEDPIIWKEKGYSSGVILPQTGQLWMPVLVLIASGLFLLVTGVLRKK